MTREYYYLVAGLPDLFLDQEKKDFNIIKLKEEIQELMHPDDYYLVELIHLEYDNFNFLNILFKRKQEFKPLGKFSQEIFNEIEENIEFLPSYIHNFYNFYKGKGQVDTSYQSESVEFSNIDRVEKILEVRFQEFYYEFVASHENRFIQEWYSFLRDFNNILTAITCRKQGIEITPQMVGGGDLVETLIRSQAQDFGLKRDIDYLEALLQTSEITDILERERRLDMLKWDKADDITTFDYFNVERILAFFVKASIVYRWVELDAKTGEELFNRFLKELKETYEMPKEFTK
jgi:hypothetical protein